MHEQLSNLLEEFRHERVDLEHDFRSLIARRDGLDRKIKAIEVLLQALAEEPDESLQSALTLAEGSSRIRCLEAAADRAIESSRFAVHVRRMPRELSPGFPVAANLIDTSGTSASRVMSDVLESAGRPLHKTEIFLRSMLHPLGPINEATMTTRLSRDDAFERVSGPRATAGFWALRSWPEGKKVNVQLTGAQYSESVLRLRRELEAARRLKQDVAIVERQLMEFRSHEASGSSCKRTSAADWDAKRDQLQALRLHVRRKDALIQELWEDATRLREELGPEAQAYPPIPSFEPTSAWELVPVPNSLQLPLSPRVEDEDPTAGEKGGKR